MGLIPVRVGGLARDERNQSPVVILQEIEGQRALPIWIGPNEAHAIIVELAGKKYPRPLTHDLLISVIEGLRGKVSRVVISDLKDRTFFANVYIEGVAGTIAIDARPSDSIAIALRSSAPIFIAEKLFEEAGDVSTGQTERVAEKTPEERAEELRRYLESLHPEDFGKWDPDLI